MAAYISFGILMTLLCITDISYYFIPNWIVLPGIFLGIILTGHWDAALVMFFVGALFFSKNKLCGGDVKLLAMLGAFIGMKAIFAFILAKGLIYIYRRIMNTQGMLPYTPFLGLASIPFLFL